MKIKLLFALAITLFFFTALFAQEQNPAKSHRTRVVINESLSVREALPTPTPTPRKVVVVKSAPPFTSATPVPRVTQTPVPERDIPEYNNTQPQGSRTLSYSEIKSKIEEAKRQMRIKPLRTSSFDTEQTHTIVRLAFYDWNIKALDYAVIPKTDFLSRDSDVVAKTERGRTVRVRTIRGNGVNTPVMIYDLYNRAQTPLLVQYPIEKYGRFVEMAYYVSTHPGIVTPETVNAGRLYVKSVLDAARAKLRGKGIYIQPKIVDIAERLALVEHVGHNRFRTEYHPRIYNDVYMLYALNQGQTYRYSVSSAGAGGMVQMIPATYRMIRSRYYQVGLMPDFVAGMRNHVNASQAMLLYMQMTWNDLSANSTISNALYEGIATQEELMAAGYNSNPARLPGYIRRGGAGWKNLIPRETKIYLQIYESVERFVPLAPRSR